MVERREIPRWQIGQKAKIRLKGALSFVDCYVHDINLKGMQVFFPLQLPDDKSVQLNLALAEDVHVEAEAQIPWHRPLGKHHAYGLSFSRIKDADRDRIYEYLCSNFWDQVKDHWWEGARPGDQADGGSQAL